MDIVLWEAIARDYGLGEECDPHMAEYRICVEAAKATLESMNKERPVDEEVVSWEALVREARRALEEAKFGGDGDSQGPKGGKVGELGLAKRFNRRSDLAGAWGSRFSPMTRRQLLQWEVQRRAAELPAMAAWLTWVSDRGDDEEVSGMAEACMTFVRAFRMKMREAVRNGADAPCGQPIPGRTRGGWGAGGSTGTKNVGGGVTPKSTRPGQGPRQVSNDIAERNGTAGSAAEETNTITQPSYDSASDHADENVDHELSLTQGAGGAGSISGEGEATRRSRREAAPVHREEHRARSVSRSARVRTNAGASLNASASTNNGSRYGPKPRSVTSSHASTGRATTKARSGRC
jgi:hypothetical protein